MTSPLDKLNDHIDQLVIWLRENKGVKIYSHQKVRLTNITSAIQSSETLSESELQKIKTSKSAVKPSTTKSITNGYIICDKCGDRLNIKNVQKHKTKCHSSVKTSGKQPRKSNKPATKRTRGAVYTDKTYYNERKVERQLDGSRDYWQIRDQGKFGSHSGYDDMGDESNS